MNTKKKQTILLAVLIILLFVINYGFLDNHVKTFLSNYESAFVERIIDGDTIEIENKTSVRLLGINCPERGEHYYKEAKEFLEELVLNETIKLEFGKDKYDRYKRILAYLHVNGKNVNLELVEQGFANFYFPSGKDRYYNKFKEAWEKCIEENKNLCGKSENKCVKCIELKNLNHKNQIIEFYNKCKFDCELTNWEIKDEGRKKFIFENFVLEKNKQVEIVVGEGTNTKEKLFWKNEDYVWTRTGDTLLLRDEEGKLVLWESY